SAIATSARCHASAASCCAFSIARVASSAAFCAAATALRFAASATSSLSRCAGGRSSLLQASTATRRNQRDNGAAYLRTLDVGPFAARHRCVIERVMRNTTLLCVVGLLLCGCQSSGRTVEPNDLGITELEIRRDRLGDERLLTMRGLDQDG